MFWNSYKSIFWCRLKMKIWRKKSAKKHLYLSDLQNFNWSKKFHLRSTTFIYKTFSGNHSFISKIARVKGFFIMDHPVYDYLALELGKWLQCNITIGNLLFNCTTLLLKTENGKVHECMSLISTLICLNQFKTWHKSQTE